MELSSNTLFTYGYYPSGMMLTEEYVEFADQMIVKLATHRWIGKNERNSNPAICLNI
jgi:hypothetical protein